MVFDDLHFVNEHMYHSFSKHQGYGEMSTSKQYLAVIGSLLVIGACTIVLRIISLREQETYESNKRRPILVSHIQNSFFNQHSSEEKDM